MNYLIWDTKIICKTPEEEKVIPKDRASLDKIKGPFQIALVRTISKRFTTALASPEELEELALRDLSPESIVCYEKIKEDYYQSFGVEKSLIDEIKSIVSPGRIDLLTPYPIAIRNFLEKHHQISSKYTIFLDDSKGMIFFSIYWGKQVSQVRVIPQEAFISEYEASRQDFAQQIGKTEFEFQIVTNSQKLKEQLILEKNYLPKDITVIDVSLPALHGLELGKREIEFVLPEQIIHKRREEDKRKKLRLLKIGASFALLGILVSLLSYTSYFRLLHTVTRLEEKQYAQTTQIEQMLHENYSQIIKAKTNPYLASTLDKFFSYVNGNYRIHLISIIQGADDKLGICVYLIPQEHFSDPIKKLKQIYPTALIEQSSIQDALVIRIIYGIDPSGEEVPGEVFQDWKFID